MKKKIVVLVLKNEPEKEYIYPSVPELMKAHKGIGITIHSLWNALAKKGEYENKVCSIRYRNNDSTEAWK